jgi:hypothetical protein
MTDPTTISEEVSEQTKTEQELLTFYRALTTFQKRRIYTIARNAYQDVQRAHGFRTNNYTPPKEAKGH